VLEIDIVDFKLLIKTPTTPHHLEKDSLAVRSYVFNHLAVFRRNALRIFSQKRSENGFDFRVIRMKATILSSQNSSFQKENVICKLCISLILV